MFISKKHLSRRTVLKGAGAAVSLPLLDAMIPAHTALANTAAAVKPRLGFVYIPHGVIPAVLLPFDNDLAIDELNFRKHLRDVASVERLSAVTINAHSTEVGSCSFDEPVAELQERGLL